MNASVIVLLVVDVAAVVVSEARDADAVKVVDVVVVDVAKAVVITELLVVDVAQLHLRLPMSPTMLTSPVSAHKFNTVTSGQRSSRIVRKV